MVARQLSFENGTIKMLGQRMLISPSDVFARYIFDIRDEPELLKNLYVSAKESIRGGFGINIGKVYGFSFKDYSKWFVELAMVAGWGKIVWEDIDENKKQGIITIQDSPVSAYLKNRVSKPCDHLTRGYIAGAASCAFREDIDIIEVECEAAGAQKCKFIMGPPDFLKKNFADISELQLV